MGLDNRKKNILATYHGRYHEIGIADLRAVSTDMKPIHSSGCSSTDSEAMNMVPVRENILLLNKVGKAFERRAYLGKCYRNERIHLSRLKFEEKKWL